MIDPYDFWLSPGRKEYVEYLIPNPFNTSIITIEMYHGNKTKGLTKFSKPIWFTATPEWCKTAHLSNKIDFGEIYVCWIDIKNPYYPNEDEIEEFLETPSLILPFLKKKKKEGYDSYIERGESLTIAVFNNVKIINALTGKVM